MFPLVSNDPIYTRSFRSIRGTIGERKDISKRLDARSNQIVGERFSVNFFSPTSLVPFSRVRFSLSLILSLSFSHHYYRIVTLRDSKARSGRVPKLPTTVSIRNGLLRSFQDRSPVSIREPFAPSFFHHRNRIVSRTSSFFLDDSFANS